MMTVDDKKTKLKNKQEKVDKEVAGL